jgi:beta-glucosidase-like glycosyl hydrolase
MGGVLSAAPIGEAAVEFVRAGGDLCLICHQEELILQAHEDLTKTAERQAKFAQRIAESSRRVLAYKKKWAKALRRGKAPSGGSTEKLSRQLWEFEEQVRLEPFSRQADKRSR